MSTELEEIQKEETRQNDLWLQHYINELLWQRPHPSFLSSTTPVLSFWTV